MMLDLTDVKKGQNCEILWMFGPAAHTLREQFKLKEIGKSVVKFCTTT